MDSSMFQVQESILDNLKCKVLFESHFITNI